MGIPFGCGSVLFLLMGLTGWQFTPSLPFFLMALGITAAAVAAGAVILIAVEWALEARTRRAAHVPAEAVTR
jgi:hypothetical protein